MKNFMLLSGIAILLLTGFFLFSGPNKDLTPLLQSVNATEVTVYKSPTCGCCEIYTEYLEQVGFSVHVENLDDMDPIKKQYEIPTELLSCHTTIIGAYFVEGHIPVEVIEKLLTEQPDINGIALPGMASGMPGMPGAKTGDYKVQQLTDDGYSLFFSL